MSDKVILITGATDGLGKVAAQKFLAAGNTVIITGRSEKKLEATTIWLRQQQQHLSNKNNSSSSSSSSYMTNKISLHSILLDLSSLESVRRAVESLQSLGLEKKISVLINNAGTTTYELEYVSETTVVEKTVFVNAVAPWYFTQLLIPLMDHEQGRILFVTSSLHDPTVRGGRKQNETSMPDDIPLDYLDGHTAWESMLFYKVSKVAQLWLALVLAQQLKNIKVIALCPGFVPTTQLNRNTSWFLRLIMYYLLSRMSFATSEEEATNGYVYYAHEEYEEGFYYRKRQVAEPSKDVKNMDKAIKFWNMTCDICHMSEKKL
ncbi:hypothetical protein BDA99DRAFT_526034 [Phascolomyces articulosus]|uniref:NAD(P)-binding protein n=1 Tax=Phascolomyces articulosus TaxID=60185 RepID=A0AAD5JZY2_9FUNG|nr:hypothetical protein BDA99DRAFT_526034 [Phascolomyces articulosus]